MGKKYIEKKKKKKKIYPIEINEIFFTQKFQKNMKSEKIKKKMNFIINKLDINLQKK